MTAASSAPSVTIRPYLALRLMMVVVVAMMLGAAVLLFADEPTPVVLVPIATALLLAPWAASLSVGKVVVDDAGIRMRTLWNGWSDRLRLDQVIALEHGGGGRIGPYLTITTGDVRVSGFLRVRGQLFIHGGTYSLPRVYRAIVPGLDASDRHVEYQGLAGKYADRARRRLARRAAARAERTA